MGNKYGFIMDSDGKEFLLLKSNMSQSGARNATRGVKVSFDIQQHEEGKEGRSPLAVNVAGRENTPFPRRRGRIGQSEMVAEDVSGTLQDYTLVFQHNNKSTTLKLDHTNMQKAKKLIKKQQIDVKFNLLRALDEDIKGNLFARNIKAVSIEE